MDDVTISAAGVDATIQLQSGMVTAAFDLGESVSAADNPLDAEGIPTVVALSPESDLVIRHGIGVDLLP